MSAVPVAILKACRQLGDRAVVAVLVKSIALTVAIFVALGAGLYAALAQVSQSAWLATFLPESLAGPAAVLVSLIVSLAGFWLLFRAVALVVLQFFADDVVAAVEVRHYPALARQARPLPLHREVKAALRGLLRVIGYNLLALPVAIALLFTAIGPGIVFLAVNAVLLGREFTDMAWLRHCGSDERGNPAGAGERLLLGAAVAVLLLIPLVNFLAPVIGAAAGTHLVLRRLSGETEG